MQQVENPMVRPNGYGIRDPQEYEPQVIATCAGCGEEILDIHDHVGDDPDMTIHNEWECGYKAFLKVIGL